MSGYNPVMSPTEARKGRMKMGTWYAVDRKNFNSYMKSFEQEEAQAPVRIPCKSLPPPNLTKDNIKQFLAYHRDQKPEEEHRTITDIARYFNVEWTDRSLNKYLRELDEENEIYQFYGYYTAL
eukprot:3939121-Rhodomonas_salina.1